MDRLTYWNCKEKGSALPVSIGDDGDVVDLETLCAKLADYEDIGLTPEEIHGMCEMDRRAKMADLLRLEDYQALGDINRLHELAAADRDGRVVMLPCKVGQVVYYYPTYGCKPIGGVREGHCQSVGFSRDNVRIKIREYHAHNVDYALGKGVFLTRAAAEAALKEQEAQK